MGVVVVVVAGGGVGDPQKLGRSGSGCSTIDGLVNAIHTYTPGDPGPTLCERAIAVH